MSERLKPEQIVELRKLHDEVIAQDLSAIASDRTVTVPVLKENAAFMIACNNWLRQLLDEVEDARADAGGAAVSDPGMTSEQRAAVAVHYAEHNRICLDPRADGSICLACAEVADQIDAAVEVERQAAEERGRTSAEARLTELEHKLNAQRAMVGAAHVAFHEAAGTAYGHTPNEDNPAAMIRLVAKEAEERGRRRGVEEAAKIIKDKVREWVNNKNDRRNSVDTVVDDACTALAPRDSMTAVEDAIEAKRKARQDEEAEAFKYAPRDSGASCGADEDGLHREARKAHK